MSQITTHILDTSRGKPAQGITIVLFQEQNNNWTEVTRGITNGDGRLSDLSSGDIVTPGIYKLRFETRAYFDRLSVQTFYPFIEIIFTIVESEHYHIPLLLSPFGYTTYRGS